jgi:hypothetical protein
MWGICTTRKDWSLPKGRYLWRGFLVSDPKTGALSFRASERDAPIRCQPERVMISQPERLFRGGRVQSILNANRDTVNGELI